MDKNSKLSNGDKITLTASYSQQTTDYLNINMTFSKMKKKPLQFIQSKKLGLTFQEAEVMQMLTWFLKQTLHPNKKEIRKIIYNVF